MLDREFCDFPELEGVNTITPKKTYKNVCVCVCGGGVGVHVLYCRVHGGPTLNAGWIVLLFSRVGAGQYQYP